MIKVLHVFGIMDRGGAETIIMNYYRHIDRSKVQFDFLVLRSKIGAYEKEIENLGGKVYRIPSLFNFISHIRAIKLFFSKNNHYNIVHSHIGELGLYIYRAAKNAGVKTIIAHAHKASCVKNYKWPLRIVLRTLMNKYITHRMTCGHDAAKWLFTTKSKQALMLNNAINAKSFAFNSETRKEVRNSMGWEDKFVIGDVARFSTPKNHSRLLSILKEVLTKEPTSLLVLVGDKTGLYKDVHRNVEEMGLSHAVQFLGAQSDIPRLLQGMDVYCSPSLYEGLSVSMVEAQAAGLRVVTSDRVPEQIAIIPELLSFIPLSADDITWTNALLSPYKRANTFDKIVTAGFDIHANAAWLQDFYLDKHHSH